MSTSTLPLRLLSHIGLDALSPADLRRLLDLLHHPALLADVQGDRLLNVNTALGELTGYAPEALVGQPPASLGITLPADPEAPFEQAIRHRNRRAIPCTVQQTPLTPRHRLLILLPLAEQAARQAAQERARQLTAALQQFLQAADGDRSDAERLHHLLESGRRLCGADSLLFYRIDGGQPRAFLEAWAGPRPDLPEALVFSLPLQAQVWQPGQPPRHALLRRAAQLGLNYLALHPVGQQHALSGALVAVHPLADPLPDLLDWLGLCAAMTDIWLTSRARQQALLGLLDESRAANRWLSAVCEHIQDGVALLDAEQRILAVNPALCRLLGYRPDELLQQPVSILLPADALSAETPVVRSLRHRDGNPLRLQITCHPLPADHRSLLILHDQTAVERARLENLRLQQSALAGQMSATFAHEIRNPLNNIKLAMETLRIKPLPEDVRQRMGEIVDEFERLQRLVESMLSISRAGQKGWQPQPVSLNNLIESAVHLFRPRAARYQVQLRFQPAPDLPAVVGDPDSLRQVLANLLDNALNAMKPQGQGVLSITTRRETDEGGSPVAAIYVADTGPGIPEDLQARIFELGVTGRADGSGFGLALCRQIISQHRGSLTLLSSQPAATIFRIRLPASQEAT